jgi:hypothetical protein
MGNLFTASKMNILSYFAICALPLLLVIFVAIFFGGYNGNTIIFFLLLIRLYSCNKSEIE